MTYAFWLMGSGFKSRERSPMERCTGVDDLFKAVEDRIVHCLNFDEPAATAAADAFSDDDATEDDNSSWPPWAAEPLPEVPAGRWRRLAASCYAAWALRFRSPRWCGPGTDAAAMDNSVVRVNLFQKRSVVRRSSTSEGGSEDGSV